MRIGISKLSKLSMNQFNNIGGINYFSDRFWVFKIIG